MYINEKAVDIEDTDKPICDAEEISQRGILAEEY